MAEEALAKFYTDFYENEYLVAKCVHFENPDTQFNNFVIHVREYLGTNFKVVATTAGHEKELVRRPHSHYHVMMKLTGKLKKGNTVTDFRRYLVKKYQKDPYNRKDISISLEKHLEIKDIKDIMQYPLKEEELSELCIGLNKDLLERFRIGAKAEYDSKKRERRKELIKMEREKSGWNKKVEYINCKRKDTPSELINIQMNTLEKIQYYVWKYYQEEHDNCIPDVKTRDREALRYILQEEVMTGLELFCLEKKIKCEDIL